MKTDFFYEKDKQGNYFLTTACWPEDSDKDSYIARIEDREFPVFRQSGNCYGKYSEYMKHHGCACCSLTTILAAYKKQWKNLTPEQTAGQIERRVFGDTIWKENYLRPMRRQMPVSLYGISVILNHYQIDHTYVKHFDYEKAVRQIKTCLQKKKIVIVETRRIKKHGWKIISVNDKKYAGSYHTMILLGLHPSGEVIFTDSAYRSWAGTSQRLKKARLEDMAYYMFGVKDTSDTHCYFHKRRGTGGYIII